MDETPVLALVPVLLMALSIGLSLLAGYLLSEPPKSPIRDERPTPLASRGSYCAWISGVRRLGYVVTWAGDRRTKKIDLGKGSFFSGKGGDAKTYKESAMHVICVGPVDALLNIEQAGKVIFEGPLTRELNPSGSLVDLGGEGSFRIFWGEDDQPVNTYLGAITRVGVNSRWPNFCYVEWRNKKLGASPNWPMLSYSVSKHPTGNHLSSTDPWIEPTYVLDGQEFDDLYAVDWGVSTITLQASSGPGNGDFTALIRPGSRLRLTGNALSNRDLTVVSAYPEPEGPGLPRYHTIIEVEEDITGMDLIGELQLYTPQADDGANIAHLTADMLFEKWPQGLSLSTSDWDLDSLEEMGVNEAAMRGSVVAKDASTAQQTLGGILQDVGYFLTLDPTTGLMRFVGLRDTVGLTLTHVDNRKITGGLPVMEKTIGQRPVDSLLFKFADREMAFRDMTIGRMEDGQIGLLEVARARTIEVPSTVHYGTAATIANRRTQEELANAAAWDITTNRSTRELYPGMPITVDFTSEVLRVIESLPVPDSNQVTLKVMVDNYGLEASDFVDVQPPIPPGTLPAQQDMIFDLIELSEYFPGVPPQTVFIPRIRAHEQIEGSLIHISADDVTYIEAIDTDTHYPGGVLLTPLSSTGFFEVEGTQFSIYGPDIAEVLDLSGDDTNWRLGRQLCLLVSSAGVEICFCKGVTIVSGETYTIDGLIRARYESRRLNHPEGTRVYIIDVQNIDTITDPLWAPEVTRYAKSQPYGAGIVDLSIVAPASRLLYGNGVRPSPVSALAVTAPHLVNAYQTGDDITISWKSHTPIAQAVSAGLVDAGTPVGTADPEGSFLVEIMNLADVVVRSEETPLSLFVYQNTDLVADLGSEVSFQVRVSELKNGQVSAPTTITIEAV